MSVKLNKEQLELRRQILAVKERELQLREGLPFLHGWKWYPWAREFYESTNKINFLCAANQISKSSTQIRKCINWATDQKQWPLLWRQKPVQFWYLYPTNNQAKIEFETKWKQFLPNGAFKDDPYYGWKEEKKGGEIFAIHFNSGVHVYFKTYAQDVQALQTGTCDALFCDEELPVELYDELVFRISASDGYFHMVFTATLGQEFWRQTMEPGANEEEKFPDAFKRVVSMYDCLLYEDGTQSHWTMEKIAVVKARCKSEAEVLRRVYGRFVVESGRKYEAFDAKSHIKQAHPLPKDWHIACGVDIGSGGEKGHKAAICFVGVSPDFRQGRVFKGWRGDGVPTTASDILEKFRELRGKMTPFIQAYDWASKDFQMISSRQGEAFIPAEKSHERGEQVLNVLFKNNMLFLYDDPELAKLAGELVSLRVDTPKNKAKDDFADALRYAVTRIPWDWTCLTGEKPEGFVEPAEDWSKLSPEERRKREQAEEIRLRREAMDDNKAQADDLAEEFAMWNDLYG